MDLEREKSALAVLLQLVAWDIQFGYITCRVQETVYRLRRSETCEGRSGEALVAEKGQLAVNSLKGRQPVEIFQSKSDVLAFLHA